MESPSHDAHLNVQKRSSITDWKAFVKKGAGSVAYRLVYFWVCSQQVTKKSSINIEATFRSP